MDAWKNNLLCCIFPGVLALIVGVGAALGGCQSHLKFCKPAEDVGRVKASVEVVLPSEEIKGVGKPQREAYEKCGDVYLELEHGLNVRSSSSGRASE